MSGEAESNVSGWTVDTAAQHIATLLARVERELAAYRATDATHHIETDLRYDNRFTAAREMTDSGFAAIRSEMAINDRRYAERYEAQSEASQVAFQAQQTAMTTALDSAQKAVNAALNAAKEAVDKAEIAASKRFDAVNEFRAQLADQAANLMPKAEALVLTSALGQRIDQLQLRSDEKVAQVAETLRVLALDARAFISRGEVDVLIRGVDARHVALSERVVLKSGNDMGQQRSGMENRNRILVVATALAAVIAIISLIVAIIFGIQHRSPSPTAPTVSCSVAVSGQECVK